MRIHTSLTADQVRACTGDTGTWLHIFREHGSRSHPRAFEVVLSGTSNHRGQAGDDDYYAATWDQWGLFFGRLFDADPTARAANVYDGAADFHWQTGDRFRKGATIQLCAQHRWLYDRAVEGKVCTKGCGSVIRSIARAPRLCATAH